MAHRREVAATARLPASDSWYLGSNVEGKARDFMVYLGGVDPYRATCEEVAARGYEGFALAASARHSRSPASAVTS